MSSEPFRGSVAVTAGRVTFRQLRGPRFRRLFRDVYVSAEVEVDLALRSRAAYLLVAGRGGMAGWSAAELLGASCGPRDAPAEVIIWGSVVAKPGLTVRRDRLLPDEITDIAGIAVTTPERTGYDLARRSALAEGVVAVDALARVHGFDIGAIRELDRRHLGARGSRQLADVLRLANPLAGSPMETRVRLALIKDGLPMPTLQHAVGPYLLDLAYPAIRLAIEYDGSEHRAPDRALRDLDRQAYLTAAGWTVVRFRAAVVYRPITVANRVRQELIRYGRRYNLTHTEVLALIDPRCAQWTRTRR